MKRKNWGKIKILMNKKMDEEEECKIKLLMQAYPNLDRLLCQTLLRASTERLVQLSNTEVQPSANGVGKVEIE